MHCLSQDRFLEVKAQLLPFLKSCGFKEASLQWLPAVGPLGENLVGPPTDPRLKAWCKGPTVVQAVDAFRPRQRNTGGLAAVLQKHWVLPWRVGRHASSPVTLVSTRQQLKPTVFIAWHITAASCAG
jgi:translation elongation factor EF-1alpha